MLTIGTIFRALLLLTNSLAVLHEERFLKKVGFSQDDPRLQAGVKKQIVGLLHACRVLRFPIMIVNIITIIVLMVTG